MQAARLHGPRDLRLEEVAPPPPPGPGQVLIGVGAVGVCGSDLHMYETGRIGTTIVETPLVLGHEFGGTVLQPGPHALDGHAQPLRAGSRVAVDPQVSCGHCRPCQEGHPNLCPNHRFYGVWPDDGALRGVMVVEARNCFPVPDSFSDATVALLETLGVALHAVDLGKLRVGEGVGVLGCGPVGLLILRLARLAGASPLYAFDPLPWRRERALELGADQALPLADPRQVGELDVVFEAAWADESVQQAAELARPGGRLVLVGIPPDDRLCLSHSTARRKGLTIRMARRMKHTYPRAIRLVESKQVDLDRLLTHRFGLEQAPQAYAMNAAYAPGLIKAVVEIS
jgi:L-iditol 2-dehydrogenase